MPSSTLCHSPLLSCSTIKSIASSHLPSSRCCQLSTDVTKNVQAIVAQRFKSVLRFNHAAFSTNLVSFHPTSFVTCSIFSFRYQLLLRKGAMGSFAPRVL